MPFTRPAEISDCVSLSDKLAALVARFVSEYRAVDAALPAGVREAAPHKHGIASFCAEDDFFSGADEQNASAAVCVFMG